MDDWFATFAVHGALPAGAAGELSERGFVVLAGPVAGADVPHLQAAYDEAVTRADAADVGLGRASTRVTDFVDRGPALSTSRGLRTPGPCSG
jgi:hypothetical protein